MASSAAGRSYDFDANGGQPRMDYTRLIGLVKASGYKGYIGGAVGQAPPSRLSARSSD